ncbi:uncharacterized protein LOC129922827 [Biomphalaria glabrata]|uniref:Uncharacterized protein LOC129922827 n=1 Tax=Biomphalaria glabrata TaxID=6526 RepID=A0A9W2YUJ4_BIOGL|nr:uncharacterized protein LOC129922827 [Biomphalaria glabrata]
MQSSLTLKAKRDHQNISLTCFVINQDSTAPDTCSVTDLCAQTNPAVVTCVILSAIIVIQFAAIIFLMLKGQGIHLTEIKSSPTEPQNYDPPNIEPQYDCIGNNGYSNNYITAI